MKDDSIDGIYDTLKQCAKISQSAGGIGLSIHNVRATGSYIKGTNGVSNGIVPMLRNKPEDAEVLRFGEALVKELTAQSAFGERLRVLLDTKDIRSAEKRWNWVRRGAPLILEIGPRDVANGQVTFMRRDVLRDGDKVPR